MRHQVAPLAFLCLSFSNQALSQQQNQTLNFYSGQKEAALGTQLALQVRRQTIPLGLADVDNYVEKIGQELAVQMPNAPEDWKFNVIRDHQTGSTHEPISLPGGWIFVPAQLILAARNEAEFAGMLAHAMAHVAERQANRQAPVAQLATIPLIFLGPAGFGGDVEDGLVPVSFSQVHRQYELDVQ